MRLQNFPLTLKIIKFNTLIKFVLILLSCLSALSLHAQTGIGTTSPHVSAKLDITASNKGFLPPRVSLTSVTDAATIASPATGLLVYNNGSVGLEAGYYYWNGASWSIIARSTVAGSGVVSADMVKLYGEAHSSASGKISSSTGYVFTVPVSGRYLFDFTSSGTALSGGTTTFYFQVRQGTTVLGSDNQSSYNNNVHVEYNGKVEVNLQSGVSYNVYTYATSGSFETNDYDRVYMKQVAGNLPINVYPWVLNGNEVYNSVGNVGIGTNSPQSTLDIRGSLAQNYTATSAATYTVLNTDNVIDLTLSGAQAISNFTASASNVNRILTFVNNTNATTKTITSYINNLGASVTTIPANATLILQSTGSSWKQINGTAASNTVITTTNGNGSVGQLLSSNGNGTYTWISLGTLKVLNNPGGSYYTQSQLQTLYDNASGNSAPDLVPNEVINAANALNTTSYKVYLGHNKWWYTNVQIGTSSNWSLFGGVSYKSDFGANIAAGGIFTFK